jgi:2-phospho-L-lactate guanylyltransferase
MIIAALPIKPFGVAKARLSPVLGSAQRSTLGRAVAARTASHAAAAGAEVLVVASDEGVAEWAKANELGVIREDPELGDGLDGAAATAARHAAQLGLGWAIIHADLPVATAEDLQAVLVAAASGPVIVPSYDGGTNIITGNTATFNFTFGTGSFSRHFAMAPRAHVITTPRLVLDLDTPRDLALARSWPSGAWLDGVLGGPAAREETAPELWTT